MSLESDIENIRATITAFRNDIENPHRIAAAIREKQQRIDQLLAEIFSLEESAERLPELLQKAEQKLKFLLKQQSLENNKQLKELLRLQKQVLKLETEK